MQPLAMPTFCAISARRSMSGAGSSSGLSQFRGKWMWTSKIFIGRDLSVAVACFGGIRALSGTGKYPALPDERGRLGRRDTRSGEVVLSGDARSRAVATGGDKLPRGMGTQVARDKQARHGRSHTEVDDRVTGTVEVD